jgi:hypothetical protein
LSSNPSTTIKKERREGREERREGERREGRGREGEEERRGHNRTGKEIKEKRKEILAAT